MSDHLSTTRGLTDLLHGLIPQNTSPEDLPRKLFYIHLERTRATDPLLAAIMPACAIPHRLDSETIGIIRGAPDDDAVNTELLHKLTLFTFVRLREDGLYVYHDATRDAILRDWHDGATRKAYQALAERLAAFYEHKGIECYERSDYEGAVRYFNFSVELMPANAGGHHWLGKTHYKLQNFSGALSDFTREIELAPGDAYAHQWRGGTYYELGQPTEALVDLTTSLLLRPKFGEAYSLRAEVHASLGNLKEAESDFTKALLQISGSDRCDLYFSRGKIRLNLQDLDGALSDFSNAIQLNPSEGTYHQYRGSAQGRLGNHEVALVDLSRAIELQPDGDKYCCRGQAHYHLGQYKESLSDLTRALKLRHKAPHTYEFRGWARHYLRNYRGAINDFTRAMRLNPDDVTSYAGRGRTYYECANYSAALADFMQAIHLRPDAARLYEQRGNTYRKMKNYSAALNDAQRAVELEPAGHGLCLRGRVKYQLQQYSDAFVDLTKATTFHPDDAGNYYWRARIHNHFQNYSAAFSDAKLAVTLDQNDEAEFRIFYALCCLRVHDFEQAVEVLEQCLQRDHKNCRALFWRGVVCKINGDYGGATNDWSEVLALLNTQSEDATSRFDMARVHLITEDIETAQKRYDDLLKQSCDLDDIHSELEYLDLLVHLFPDDNAVSAMKEQLRSAAATREVSGRTQAPSETPPSD
jgi:tetratricopeptide (TPR) repeat protein